MPAARFARRLNLDYLTKASVDENPWFRELLRSWRVSGTPADMTSGDMTQGEEPRVTSTRLAVRKDYMTFYTAGNQTAYVRCSRHKFYEAANGYFLKSEMPGGKSKDRIPVPPPKDGDWAKSLATRIYNGRTKQGGEKRFVDEVVGANPGIIDLEATLSLVRGGAIRPTAVRLDLVGLEPHLDRFRLTLWEAKLALNGEARSIAIPKTITKQHADYVAWFSNPQNCADFIQGCRESCRYLVLLHSLAKYAGNNSLAPLDPMIVAIGTDPACPLELDPKVRYLIDARDQKYSAFVGNGHDKKLEDYARTICQVVSDKNDSLKLRTL